MAQEADVGYEDGQHNTSKQRRCPGGDLVRAKAGGLLVMSVRHWEMNPFVVPEVGIGFEGPNGFTTQQQKDPYAVPAISIESIFDPHAKFLTLNPPPGCCGVA